MAQDGVGSGEAPPVGGGPGGTDSGRVVLAAEGTQIDVEATDGAATAGPEQEVFFPVPLAIMQPGTMAPVDLYITTEPDGAPNLYKTAQTPLTEEIRERLMERGVESLLVRNKDEEVYASYVEEHIDAIIRDDLLPVEQACRIVYRSSSRVMVDVLANPRSGKNMRRAQKMVEGTVLSIMKSPDALWQMTSVASHDYYTYTHCVNVCMFLVALSREVLNINDPHLLERIGLGGLLHDVGKSEIPESILNKPGRLTDDEFAVIKEHPQRGVELVSQTTKLPIVSGRIILGHHERYNGMGYPDGLKGDAISEVVRLSTVCDVYDALTTRRPYAEARQPFDALALMLNEMPEHFDGRLLRQFVRFLGPRPEKPDAQEARAEAERILRRATAEAQGPDGQEESGDGEGA